MFRTRSARGSRMNSSIVSDVIASFPDPLRHSSLALAHSAVCKQSAEAPLPWPGRPLGCQRCSGRGCDFLIRLAPALRTLARNLARECLRGKILIDPGKRSPRRNHGLLVYPLHAHLLVLGPLIGEAPERLENILDTLGRRQMSFPQFTNGSTARRRPTNKKTNKQTQVAWSATSKLRKIRPSRKTNKQTQVAWSATSRPPTIRKQTNNPELPGRQRAGREQSEKN